MATETLSASVNSSANLVNDTNVVADDTSWATASSNNADSIIIVDFPTPTGPPNTGAGLQGCTVKYRVTANANSVSFAAYILEGGTRLNGGSPVDTWSSTSTTEVTREVTWDASLLGTSDGSAAQLEVYATRSGGSPANRTAGEFQYVDWDVDYSLAALNINATGIASAEALGSPTASAGAVTRTLTGITSEEALGSPSVGQTLFAEPTGIASEEAVPTPALSAGAVTVTTTAIASDEALGSPTLDPGVVTVTTTGIASEETIGNPNLGGILQISPTGLTSAEGFGTIAVDGTYTISLTGIGTQEVFGTLTTATGPVSVTITGITSGETIGGPNVGDLVLSESLMEKLIAEGYVTGTVNDRFVAFLGDQGYDGAYNDRLSKFLLAKYPEQAGLRGRYKYWEERNFE